MIDRVVTVADPGRVILVAGGAAAGKSALCAAVRADMAASAHVVHVAATATATPYLDTLVGILSALGFRVEPDTDPQALIELIAHEAVQADDAPLCLVIIDDAHALPFGDLQALIGLLAGSRLCLVLTGPDSLTLLVEGLAELNHC
ncbi:MAG: ATP-binding protein, partial [Gammaproteobacteria bacterium]